MLRAPAILLALWLTGCALYEPDEVFYAEPAGLAQTGLDDASVAELRRQALAAGIDVGSGGMKREYELLERVTTTVFVLDAASEANAELAAFYRTVLAANAAGANNLIEIKRAILTDAMAEPDAAAAAGPIHRAKGEGASIELDQFTLDNYLLGIATLSTRRIDRAFDRAGRLNKSVRFTAKAVRVE